MTTIFTLEFDWGADGIWVDESAYLREARARIGMLEGALYPPAASVAAVGRCTLTLDNSTRRFSPENDAGPLYGNLTPMRKARIRANEGSTSWPIFTGFIEMIAPQAGLNGERQAVITLIDAIGRLHAAGPALPLQQNIRADELIDLVLQTIYSPEALELLTGAEVFEIAADRWDPETTTALDMIREAAASEFGRAFVQPDDTFTFLNRAWFFSAQSPALTITDAHPVHSEAAQSINQVYNDVQVTAYPRAIISGPLVLARAVTSLRIPPIGPNGAGVREIRLRFRDPQTGEFIGGTELVTPVPNTDYKLNERKDGTGVDYTVSPYTSLSVVDASGSGITVRVTNSALGPLYLNNLQVRGKAITRDDPLIATAQDNDSSLLYGQRSLRFALPLPGSGELAEGLALYILDQRRAVLSEPRWVKIRDFDRINGVNVFSLRLFDSITLSDSQSGLAGVRCWVTAIETTLTPGHFTRRFRLERADVRRYFALNNSGYAELGINARLAV